jgi:hypothetical protein
VGVGAPGPLAWPPMDLGGVIMAIVLLLFPVLVAIGGFVLSALLGGGLSKRVDMDHEGSELIELSR